MIVVESFLDAMTSAPITFTELPAKASFLAFSARYLFKMPKGVSITSPARLYNKILDKMAYENKISK
jgi:hypothetical protein